MITLYGNQVTWLPVSDHDPGLRQLADRHYSRKTPGAKKYVGPGEYLALITPDGTPHRADTDAVSAFMAYEIMKGGN